MSDDQSSQHITINEIAELSEPSKMLPENGGDFHDITGHGEEKTSRFNRKLKLKKFSNEMDVK